MLEFVDRWADIRDRATRRRILSLGGIGMSALTAQCSGPAGTSFAMTGRPLSLHHVTAKRLIFLSLFGGPPHQETYDIKDDAPSDFRGEFQSISTSVPGFRICEYMPKLAAIAHMYTVVRSMTHGDNGHESAYYSLMTGRPHPSPNTANARPTPGDYPNYGSALSFLRPSADSVPAFVVAGGLISTHIGQTGGFLGSTWSPYVIRQDADLPDFSVPDFALPESMSPERLNERRGLLARLRYSEIASNPSSASEGFLRHQQRAFDLMTGSRLQSAFDIDAESPATRAAYGDNWFGQNVLLARRLSEAGVPVVQVNYRIEIVKAGRVQCITVL